MSSILTILVIDDDPLLRKLVASALEQNGMIVNQADSGETGLELYEQSGADAVLIDVMLRPGGLDGFAVCKQLRKLPHSQHVPVLMMTALNDIDSIRQAYEAGATDFITKPINSLLLDYRIRYMLRHSELTQSLLEREKQLHRLAYFDTLTGLPNRQFFLDHLNMMIALAKRHNLNMGLLYIDLDNFKRINDTLGHHIGDLLIQLTGKRLRQGLRVNDAIAHLGKAEDGSSIARLAGDEFVVLLSGIGRNEDIGLVVSRVQECLSQPSKLGNHEIYTTSSIGIATFPDDGDSAEQLLQMADLAMYHAKNISGDSFQFFDPNMTENANRRLKIENHLRKAIEKDELHLVYQLQADITQHTCVGVEALLRWNSQELGFVPPVDFIQIAEETGLIITIGEWVLRTACRQAKEWQTTFNKPIRVAVNVSGVQIFHNQFPDQVKAILSEYGVAPELLELELTESTLAGEDEHVLGVLHKLNDIGVHLAIDDFGTGYSNLNRLRKFPIKCLKIDKSFIHEIESDPASIAIISGIIGMAKGLNLHVIAEGVETESQQNVLKQFGCEWVQGYFIAKPMAALEVENKIKTQSF